MAIRPVFTVKESSPFYSIWNCEFEYNSGFSTVQKQKNIAAIHRSFEDVFPQKRILEISSKSTKELGVRLSAFNLTKHVPELGRSVPTECVYQAGKVFAGNVQYKDLLGAMPKDAKRDERLSSSGRIVAFSFDGAEYPTDPPTAFYDFLYINALLEHKDLLAELLEYDAFTDIEFNPQKSINCQARAAAIFVSLAHGGMIDKAKNYYVLADLLSCSHTNSVDIRSRRSVDNEKETEIGKTMVLGVGQTIKHPTFGGGRITKVSETTVTIAFDIGEKIISIKWLSDNCKTM